MNSVSGSCGILAVHRLFVLTLLSDLPFAVSCARAFVYPYVVWTLSFSFFLFSFSPVWRVLWRNGPYTVNFILWSLSGSKGDFTYFTRCGVPFTYLQYSTTQKKHIYVTN